MVPAHSVPEAVVKQLQLKARGPGVGCAVGTGTGVASGVGCANGTLTRGRGAPGRRGTDGRVSGGGAGGAGATWACRMANDPAAMIAARTSAATRWVVLPDGAEILITGCGLWFLPVGRTERIGAPL
jgi:hypothetical protein